MDKESKTPEMWKRIMLKKMIQTQWMKLQTVLLNNQLKLLISKQEERKHHLTILNLLKLWEKAHLVKYSYVSTLKQKNFMQWKVLEKM